MTTDPIIHVLCFLYSFMFFVPSLIIVFRILMQKEGRSALRDLFVNHNTNHYGILIVLGVLVCLLSILNALLALPFVHPIDSAAACELTPISADLESGGNLHQGQLPNESNNFMQPDERGNFNNNLMKKHLLYQIVTALVMSGAFAGFAFLRIGIHPI